MIYAIAWLLVVLGANRVGHWLDNLNTGLERVWEGNRLEWDFTLAGVFIATLAYLIFDHIYG